MMNCLKKLIILVPLILVTQSNKLIITQTLLKLKIKINDFGHAKYITAQKFDKLTSEKFTASLAQINLASKNDIANFVKNTDFQNKLMCSLKK